MSAKPPKSNAAPPTPGGDPTAAKRKPEDAMAAALTALRRARSGDRPGEEFREELFAECRKLIHEAIEQAKKGKPALLRILCRYTR